MRFVKDNAFLVGTAGALVIGVAVIAVLGSSWGGDFDRNADLRTKPSRALANVARRLVNDKVLAADRKAVAGMRAEHRKVADRFFERTAGSYKLMQFQPEELGTQTPQPAFPIGTNELKRSQFAKAYERSLKALLEPLKATWRPTDEEIRQLREDVQKKAEFAGARAGLAAAPMEGYRGPLEVLPGGPGSEQVKKDPFQLALEGLVASKAAAGLVYADSSVLLPRLRQTLRYNDKELYLAQVALWVYKDVVEAIRRTNAAARPGQPQRTGVSGSGVRRLISARLLGYVVNMGLGDRGTVMGTGDMGVETRSGMGTSTGTEAAAGSARPTMQTYLGLVGGTGGAGMDTERFVGGTGGGMPLARLTGRVTNKLYDVVHYELKVLVDDRELVRLFNNLLVQNYHTILDVTVTRLWTGPTEGGAALAAGGGQLQREDLFEYGPAPVMQVTIKGELLLMADFTRGRWNEEAQKFDEKYPPLMPEEFLREINGHDTNALRPEDSKRILQAPTAGVAPRMGG